ncbi:MAG: amino acid adenylation domain-containing protein, partial [bacterium]|nr:amino acid adenylation domain-containing protein [bacterium]
PELPIHYVDFAQWQNQMPAKLMDSLFSYWKSQLSGKLQALELPEDRPRPLIHTYRGKRQTITFPKEICRRVRDFGKQHGAGNFITLFAVFKVLLYKYTGQEEIVVGISAENRKQPGSENMIGPLANLLVIRDYLSEDLRFSEFASQLDKTVKDAYKNQYMPFDKLVLELKPDKDMSRTAFFDVLFRYEDSPLSIPPVDNLEITVVESNLGWGKYDLNILIQDEGDEDGSFNGILVYNSDIFNDSTITRMIGHYSILLERILEDPHQPIEDPSLVTEAEKEQLLAKWNQAEASFPTEKTIHQLFEEQVSGSPDRIALKGPGLGIKETLTVSLSYRQLNHQAHQLAQVLRSKGVGPDSIVAMILDRTLEMIVAIMGILKAGGAYLPIDPEYPQDRIDYMLKDSGAKALVADEEGVKKVTETNDQLSIINYHLSIKKNSALSASSAVESVLATNLAYIIYTSGTTGRPKGVLIEHRNVVRLLFNDSFQFDFNHRDVWTMFHSYCFDFSVWEMYGALLYGGSMILIPGMVARDTGKFLRVLKDEGVTVLNQTPSAFYSLIHQELGDSKDGEKPKDGKAVIRYVVFGGEALHPASLKTWRAAYPHTRLINMYGITETTVHVTFKEIDDNAIAGNISNIGQPIPTLEVFIMDSSLTLQPQGIPGECCVGGEGVARGYLNRPKLTAEKFIQNPYKPGERLYRSGDLVKVNADDEMEYLGRIDRQVKIRGFRIELGEIENQLLKHPDINDAVVTLVESPGAGNVQASLAGYIVSDTELTVPDLRNYLSGTLPSYMVPSYFVTLGALPLTPNGKVDRSALPRPEIGTGEEYVEPRDEIEWRVVNILSDILGIGADQISVRSNWFDIGVNSISLLRIANQLSTEFDTKIHMASLFSNPTVESVARDMRANVSTEGIQRIILLSHGKAPKNLFLLTGDGAVYGMKHLANLLGDHYNIYAIQAKGIMQTGELPQTREEIVNEYIDEMRTLQPEGPYLLVGHCLGSVVAYHMIAAMEKKKIPVHKLVVLDVYAFMDESVSRYFQLKRYGRIVRDHYYGIRYLVLRSLFRLLKKQKKTVVKEEDETNVSNIDENENKKSTDTVEKTETGETENRLPEDLEARRKEVQANLERLFDKYEFFTRIIDTPILVFKAEFGQGPGNPRWHPRAWGRLSKKPVEVLETTGDHYSMLQDPHATLLVKMMLEKM